MSAIGPQFYEFMKKLDENNDKLPTSITSRPFQPEFEFSNITCYLCNGYYGPSFGEPVCVTCHEFIYPDIPHHIPNSYARFSEKTDDGDSGNDEPSVGELMYDQRLTKALKQYGIPNWAFRNSLDSEASPEDVIDVSIRPSISVPNVGGASSSNGCNSNGGPNGVDPSHEHGLRKSPSHDHGLGAGPFHDQGLGTGPSRDHRLGAGTSRDHSLGAGPSRGHSLGAGPSRDHSLGAGPSRDHSLGAGPSRDHSLGAGPSRDHSLGASTSRDHSLGAGPSRDHSLGAGPSRDHSLGAGTSRDHSLGAGPSRDHSLGAGPSRDHSLGAGPSRDHSLEAGPSRDHNLEPGLPHDDGLDPPVPDDDQPRLLSSNLARSLAALSTPRLPDNLAPGLVEQLPSEVLLCMFSYLDDLSLCACAQVCARWFRLVRARVAQPRWADFANRRWPLYRPMVNIHDWHKKYQSLVESCFCRNCVVQMCVQSQPPFEENAWRRNRLRNEIKMLRNSPPEGCAATPLDPKSCHWQAMVTGPVGSPYEGGVFYLYIQVPYSYPMSPPVVRFLTRILHPNVSRHGDVGIDSVHHNWSLALTISKLLISIQSLLTDPYTAVCMEPEVGEMYVNERARFDRIARRWTWRYAMHDIYSIN